MLISEEISAAEIVLSNGDVRYYDDLGCLAEDAKTPPGRHRAYVRGDGGKTWVVAEDAFYARPAGLRTPMAYGFAAFSRVEAARAVDTAGRALTWDEVRAELRRAERPR
jgi:hypothetical protein